MRRSPLLRELGVLAVLAALYFVTGKLGLKLAFVNASATAVWPPTGIALAAFIILGYRVWPAILLGAFLVNLTTAGSTATSVGIERSRRTGRSFAVLLVDLDGLKQINDAHGHLVGSRALCRVAHVLRLECRTIDTAARYGGDEFALVLPETGAQGVQELARRIAGRLANDGEQPPLSISAGSAVYPYDGETVVNLFRAADHALYEMKRQGRGKLSVSA